MNRLKMLREELGWNMSEVAKRFNLPYTTYVSYEKGARTPSFETVCDLAEFYDVSVTYLMGTDDVRGHFPRHDEDGIDDPDQFIALYQAAPRQVQDAILALLKAAKSGHGVPDADSTAQ